MKKLLIVGVLCSCLLSVSAFAGSRVDTVVNDSAQGQLDLIDCLTREIALGEAQLKVLASDLEIAAQKNPGHEVFLKTRNVAGITTLVAVATSGVGVVLTNLGYAGPYGAGGAFKFAAVFGGLVAVLSGTVTTVSEAGVLLTHTEADQFREEIKILQSITALRKKELRKEVELLCRQNSSHELCR